MERRALQEVIHHRSLRDPLSQAYPSYVLVEVELNWPGASEQLENTFGEAYEKGLITDVVVSESVAQAQELMNLRDLIGETLSSHYTLHKNDISVPVPSIPAFLHELHAAINEKYAALRAVVFGHVGDGNLHVNILKTSGISDADFWKACHEADHTVFSLVQRYGGSVSAEHGVGLLKRDFLGYSRPQYQIDLMRNIKRAFDPLGILNPGKIFAAC
jgi:FAD/FMN-containing dehydrogenase